MLAIELLLIASFVIMLAWYPCCCDAGGVPGYANCGNCDGTGNNAPQYFTVAIPGLIDGSCGSCEDYAGTYVCEWSTTCVWYSALVDDLCSDVKYRVGVLVNANELEVKLITYILDGGSYQIACTYTWAKTYAGDPTCLALVDEAIEWEGRAGCLDCANSDPGDATVDSGDTT